jgi:heavy metal translocating P-type ATPase
MSAALVVGEHLAAAVVALMYAGGQHLEAFAEGRARREMTALLSRAPKHALLIGPAGLREVALESVVPGDRLLIRRGDVVPVDGTVAKGLAELDQSALTGEALPVRRREGEAVESGSTNAGDVFELGASRRASESVYAGIVRLVEAAQHARAPMARLADRYALIFLVVTVALAVSAWIVSGDPVRAVAVLVVATPCPLILAVPVALVAGMSRAARHGVLVKGGQVIESLARVRVIVLDKTGTLTRGQARIVAIEPQPGYDAEEILRLAASLDQASPHVVARTLVQEASARALALTIPVDVVETPGEGLVGAVLGRRVAVGGEVFVRRQVEGACEGDGAARTADGLVVAVALDGMLAGRIYLSDTLRDGAAEMLRAFRAQGIRRIALATGDRQAIADSIASGLDLDLVRAELTPTDKVAVVSDEKRFGAVMMVGDGVNDAPALAAADVGVALGAHGSAASTETADVVLLVDRLDRVSLALSIAVRARQVALQSVLAGIGLSLAAMGAAAAGMLTPVQGALVQEAIDVTVILNALRALRD